MIFPGGGPGDQLDDVRPLAACFGSKFTLVSIMGLVKINPQNELGDIISGPLVALVIGTWHPGFF